MKRKRELEEGGDLGHHTTFHALMPTLCWSSPLLKSTADGLSLAAEITHELKLAVDDEPILKIQKFPSPESLDILSSSNVLLRLTGTFEMKRVSTETLRRSSLAAYLLEYLKFVRSDPASRRIHSLLSPTLHSIPPSCLSAAYLTPTSMLMELLSVRALRYRPGCLLTIACSCYHVVSCVAGPR